MPSEEAQSRTRSGSQRDSGALKDADIYWGSQDVAGVGSNARRLLICLIGSTVEVRGNDCEFYAPNREDTCVVGVYIQK